jgi:hypothetical protein
MMKTFRDAAGRAWVASAREEDTPRHHGRWFLVFHPEEEPGAIHAIPEVRWQTEATAARTLRTMSDFELRRRLRIVRGRGAQVARSLSAGQPGERSSASTG